MGSRLTEEQAAFAAAVRDFAKRECGTREQRDALTDGGREAHHPELYRRLADLGWLGICLPEGTAARAAARPTPVCSWRRRRTGWCRAAASSPR